MDSDNLQETRLARSGKIKKDDHGASTYLRLENIFSRNSEDRPRAISQFSAMTSNSGFDQAQSPFPLAAMFTRKQADRDDTVCTSAVVFFVKNLGMYILIKTRFLNGFKLLYTASTREGMWSIVK